MGAISLEGKNGKIQATLYAECSICGKEEKYICDETESLTVMAYEMDDVHGYLQDDFPKIPAWIRSSCLDERSGGFCICPDCC